MNKVHLVGRVTKDIELRSTKNGKPVTSFYIAVNRRNEKDQTDFIPCVAWDKTAELLSKYISRGDRIGVTGRINTRNYEDKNGKVYVTEVVVEELYFLNQEKQQDTPKSQKMGFRFEVSNARANQRASEEKR